MKFKIQYQEKRSPGCPWQDCAPEDEFSFSLKDAALRKLRALRSIPALKNFDRFRLVEVTPTDLKNKKLIEELPDDEPALASEPVADLETAGKSEA